MDLKEDMLFDIQDIMHNTIVDHMENQPYNCVCAECGEDLSITTKIDDDYDLTITVEPCQCVKED